MGENSAAPPQHLPGDPAPGVTVATFGMSPASKSGRKWAGGRGRRGWRRAGSTSRGSASARSQAAASTPPPGSTRSSGDGSSASDAMTPTRSPTTSASGPPEPNPPGRSEWPAVAGRSRSASRPPRTRPASTTSITQLIPLMINEIRRLFNRVARPVQHALVHVLHRSNRRRASRAGARAGHDKHRHHKLSLQY